MNGIGQFDSIGAEVGDTISLTYKGGRHAKCVITHIYDRYFDGVMLVDYVGQNEEWQVGEVKSFNIREGSNYQMIKKKNDKP